MQNQSGHPILPEPRIVLGGVLFLMTKHAQSRCPMICGAIAEQLRWLARHPSGEISERERIVFAKLARQWHQMAFDPAIRTPALDSYDAVVPERTLN